MQIREPSPSSSRLASESSRVPHVLQRKQSMCHRFPAVQCQYDVPARSRAAVQCSAAQCSAVPCRSLQWSACARATRHRGQRGQAHLVQRLCPPRGSGAAVSRRRGTRGRCHYLSAPLTRIHDIVLVAVLVEQRLRVAARRRVHGGRARRGRAQSSGGEGRRRRRRW